MGVLDKLLFWRRPKTEPQVSAVQEAPSSSTTKTRDPNVAVVKRVGLAIGDVGRDFEAPEFDFNEITNVYNAEAYVRQACDKYIELMFKAGWQFVGANPKAVDYIRKRFAMIAEATQIPTDQLFIEIAEDLVKYGNAIIAKARSNDPALLPPGFSIQGLGGRDPVVGYFPLNVATMTVKRDKNGMVKQWQQEVEGQEKPVKFKPEDIIHIYYKREKGHAFGTPFLLPVLDDIRALRQAEENVLRLIYRNLFPYIHVKVGLPEEGLGASDSEVNSVRNVIENMSLEAGLVTNERVEITPVATDKIIDAHDYLRYFEQRVFTGLGVSELMMGRGNTANRSTGDNLYGEFIDRVKAFQRVMSIFVDQFMVKELLMEGGFDPVLNPEDDVDFIFNEIDIDAKIKKENHVVFLYEHNAITEDEMRQLLGREPIPDSDREKMYLYRVKIPGNVKKDNAADTDNRNQPENQYGKKPSPGKTKGHLDLFADELDRILTELNQAVVGLIQLHYEKQLDGLEKLPGVIRYAEERVEEMAKQCLSEREWETIRFPLHRTFAYLGESLMGHFTYTSEATQKEAPELGNATFEVLRDRFFEVIEKLKQTQGDADAVEVRQ